MLQYREEMDPEVKPPRRNTTDEIGAPERYAEACRLALDGHYERARAIYRQLLKSTTDSRVRARIVSDLATLTRLDGDVEAACRGFRDALALDANCHTARANLALLQDGTPGRTLDRVRARSTRVDEAVSPPRQAVRVAIVNLLFNWPTTGGGVFHTVGLGQFLARDGFEVRHFYAVYPPWGIGAVEGPVPVASVPITFDDDAWSTETIQLRFREAVRSFHPDYVIVTGSWNSMPLLAEAVGEYPFLLRLGAMECLCPLNNVRLLCEGEGRFSQCLRHQLATPEICHQCIERRGHLSGPLHQRERALSGVGTPEYDKKLRWAFEAARAVLVVNPLIQMMVGPHARDVRVVTSGFDPERFSGPWPDEARNRERGVLRIFFGGLVADALKGFRVLHAACTALWKRRRDFTLIATGEPRGQVDEFTHFVGWLPQDELPHHLRAADVVVFPTIAQEALGRTAVEAMAVGRPVVASRIGGLPFTVANAGLLAEPGDPDDLARKIAMLLDDADLRAHLGAAGRRRFEEAFTWDVIIKRHYMPLLASRVSPGFP
ncbi:MAG TPA: glycosyltransferase family 4 protein [Thermoguttaceae bacterium]|nr:glycosyltransferase family 4 protein [Thermoguttaceae bacterium]